uniref:Putative ribonuclease ZC3H12D n=2 Tax=Ceratitis capitata TaxID=7213 RepID=W8BCL0_CERCA
MRSSRKQKNRRIKRRSFAHHYTNRIHATPSSDSQIIVSSSTNLKGKRRKLKPRGSLKRLSKKEKLAARNIFAQKRKNKQSEATDLTGTSSTVVHEIAMPYETPLTAGSCHKRTGFKKFRDTTERRLKLRRNRLNRDGRDLPIPSTSQRITKKLLRAIRKRQLKNLNRTKQLEQRNNLKRKLNLPNNSSIKELHIGNISLEEGEIISDDEDKVTLPANNHIDDDDDCICIEPQIEQIIIDDDKPNTSRSRTKNNVTSGYVSLIQRMNDRSTDLQANVLTSTPHVARNSTQNLDDGFGNLSAMFFEDVSSVNTLQTISSEDTLTNYTKLSRLVRNPKTKSKKKNRIRKKSGDPTTVSEDVIILDDTANESTLKPTAPEEANQTHIDDSVIFICETAANSDKPAQALDFVPLHSDNVPNPIAMPVSPPRAPRRAAINSGLFTNSEKKQLTAYNNNTYNPNAGDPQAKEKLSAKRLILIDACNVAFNHALNKEFSVKGLKICIEYFEKMGHDVKAVVPQFRMHRCSDTAAMFELHSAGKIVVTPCKNLPGKFTISYDDRFILQLAAEMDAVIVSNDNYRDLINENTAFKKLIENRVIGFTWCNDLFMVAKDPYGKWGPSLHTILNRV